MEKVEQTPPTLLLYHYRHRFPHPWRPIGPPRNIIIFQTDHHLFATTPDPGYAMQFVRCSSTFLYYAFIVLLVPTIVSLSLRLLSHCAILTSSLHRDRQT